MDWLATYWGLISAIAIALISIFSFWHRQTTVSRRQHYSDMKKLVDEIKELSDELDDVKVQIGQVASRDDIHGLQLQIAEVNGTMNTMQATFKGFADSMEGVKNIANLITEKAIKGGS